MEKKMKRVQKVVNRGLALTLMLVLLYGCAATGGKPALDSKPTRSGFLSNYDLLKPIEGGDGAQSWRRTDVDWKQYDKALIERIKVFVKEDSKHKGIDPPDLKMLTDYFYEAIVKELKPTVELVDKSGPGVIGIRIAIVDLVPTEYARSIAGTLIPYGFVAEASSGAASGRPAGSTPYLGECAIEVQIVDGASGQILGEYTDTRIGKKYNLDTSKGATNAAKKWVDGYVDSFTSWNYAKEAFDHWAAFLRQRFNELRGY